ncbi:MAG: hypothetical protein ACI9W2_002153 [Gammaproteobacteria bacterium]|jgi:hypothetical protein
MRCSTYRLHRDLRARAWPSVHYRGSVVSYGTNVLLERSTQHTAPSLVTSISRYNTAAGRYEAAYGSGDVVWRDEIFYGSWCQREILIHHAVALKRETTTSVHRQNAAQSPYPQLGFGNRHNHVGYFVAPRNARL